MPTKKKVTKKETVKKEVKKTAKTSRILVGWFGKQPVSVLVTANSTVGQVLEKAGITPGKEERIWLNNKRAKTGDKVKDGDVIGLISPKEAGNI